VFSVVQRPIVYIHLHALVSKLAKTIKRRQHRREMTLANPADFHFDKTINMQLCTVLVDNIVQPPPRADHFYDCIVWKERRAIYLEDLKHGDQAWFRRCIQRMVRETT
jgi:hypothetical protein